MGGKEKRRGLSTSEQRLRQEPFQTIPSRANAGAHLAVWSFKIWRISVRLPCAKNFTINIIGSLREKFNGNSFKHVAHQPSPGGLDIRGRRRFLRMGEVLTKGRCMKHFCPTCLGHVELEGEYHKESLTCPHCQCDVQFEAVTVPPPIPLVDTLSPPVIQSLSLQEMAGPDQPLEIVAEVLPQLAGFCTADERVMRVVVQSRLMSLSIRPNLIAATNRRLIVLHRGAFSCRMWDALWIDVFDVRIQEGITGASLIVKLVNGTGNIIERLPKEAARSMYRFCQSHEEMMRAARHAHTLHAASAAAAKVNVNVNVDRS